jgi:hypothetical protein
MTFPQVVACLASVAMATPLAAQHLAPEAERVLAAAQAALGNHATVAQIRTIETVAECRGPRRAYRTMVWSATDGRVLFEQQFDSGHLYRAGLSRSGGWEYDPDSARYTRATPLTYADVQGHEIHLLIVAPQAIFGRPLGVRDTMFAGHDAVAVSFRDTLGGLVTGFYARADTLALGFSFPDHRNPGGKPVVLLFSEWRRIDGIRLATRAVYWQGRDPYRFRFTRIRLNSVADSVFAMPRAADSGPSD